MQLPVITDYIQPGEFREEPGNLAPFYSLDDPAADHQAHAISMDEAGDTQASIASFRASVEFSPDESMFWNNLGVALLELADGSADDITEIGNNEAYSKEAMSSFKQAVTLDPANAEAQQAFMGLLLTHGKNLTAAFMASVGDKVGDKDKGVAPSTEKPSLPFLPPRIEDANNHFEL